MIFVTVGTHEQPFNRLLESIDKLIEKGIIKEKVIMQIGYSTYIPKHAEWFRFKDFNSIKKIMKRAKIVITHGGTGSIFTALNLNKRVIVVPRLKKFREHTDDHQLQIVKELEKEKMLIGVYDIDQLEEALKKVKRIKMNLKQKLREKKIPMIPIINDFLKNLNLLKK
jgi:UDP-N-acetylglucosamine transferase subunit ALG13